jgi:hypothetical protein
VKKDIPLAQLKRWAGSDKSVTLDLGDYASDYVTINTSEATAITSLIAGYVDILLKSRTGYLLLLILYCFLYIYYYLFNY